MLSARGLPSRGDSKCRATERPPSTSHLLSSQADECRGRGVGFRWVSPEVVLNLHQRRPDTLHDDQRDMNVLVRLDVREPVFKDGGKLDLLEHVSSPALLRTS